MSSTKGTLYRVEIERDVVAVMRDGVTLRADIYRPVSNERLPVLLIRSPYGKSTANATFEKELFPKHGYILVVQDTRGRYASDGEFYPYFPEVNDGYDTVEWAAKLPGSTGQVAMVGQSYKALAQYLAAKSRPPSLTALCPVSAPVNHLETATYRSGAFKLLWNLEYFLWMSRETLQRKGQWERYRDQIEGYLRDPETAGAISDVTTAPPNRMTLERLPLRNWIEELKVIAPHFGDFLSHPSDDGFWDPIEYLHEVPNIKVPMFQVGSWYDAFQSDTLKVYQGMIDSGSPHQKLLMGPWGHLAPFAKPTTGGAGEADFGPHAAVDILGHQLKWLDFITKGKRNGVEQESPVRIFVMGRNQWRDEAAWPLARARPTSVFLVSAGEANSSSGDGTLSFEISGDQRPDTFIYDPANPVMTRGGSGLSYGLGAFDQRETEARPDVLVYTSASFESELEVTGHIILKLFASSSAPDTDFTAKLVDVHTDGYAQNMADGIIRARYRNSRSAPELLKPGEVYLFTIDLWSISHVFLRGHRMRLEVSSSNFPRFDRNPNTGHDFGVDATLQIANQTIYHDQARPSRLILPVVRDA